MITIRGMQDSGNNRRPMTRLLRFVLILLAVIVLAAGGLFLAGPERLWEQLGGPADQGAIVFPDLSRSPTPNDALACSPGACSGGSDIELPLYQDAPAALLDRLDQAVLADPNVTRVDDRAAPNYRRYVARTPVLRFPDTIDVEALRGDGGTRLRLYSRSLLGKSDLGANSERLETWKRRLGEG